ncbi:MAG TPA: alpha/beta fold hydrolase [Burkholderiales bacterium]|nr:alpha/beta fold hydrolase [Burkholderiales bacterium]
MSAAAPADRYVEVAGLRTRYIERGAGPAVLLLHGASLGSSADVWTRNLDALAAHGLRVVAFDQPGFGLSEARDDHSVGFRTRFVPAFMDALGLERAHLVGHSQSGRFAVSLALSQPERVGRAVVVATGSLLPPLPGAAAQGEGDEGEAAEPTLEDTRAALEATVFRRELITPDVVALRHRMSTGKNFRAFLARRRARGGENKGSAPLWQRLGEVRVPMRLIYGADDRGDCARRARLALERFPGLDLHLIERCKHLVHWDAPERFAELAGRFLAS